MNKTTINQHLRRKISALAVAALTSTSLIITAGIASADYGPGALYQVALSANQHAPPAREPGSNGGVWLWFALYPDGTANYAGADCGNGEGGFADHGDTNWTFSGVCTLGSYTGQCITIYPVILTGLDNFPATVMIPAVFGHYTGTAATFLPDFAGIVPPGVSQLQVSP